MQYSKKRGLILGKFYPPHRGHKYLIETAQNQVDQLFVILCADSTQDISPELRKQWLQDIHPRVTFLVLDQGGFDVTKAQEWVDQTVKLLGFTPDVIFSSEDYGEEYAQLAGCEHIMIDKDRTVVNCSASQIRSNPEKYLHFLEPVVRAYFRKGQ